MLLEGASPKISSKSIWFSLALVSATGLLLSLLSLALDIPSVLNSAIGLELKFSVAGSNSGMVSQIASFIYNLINI